MLLGWNCAFQVPLPGARVFRGDACGLAPMGFAKDCALAGAIVNGTATYDARRRACFPNFLSLNQFVLKRNFRAQGLNSYLIHAEFTRGARGFLQERLPRDGCGHSAVSYWARARSTALHLPRMAQMPRSSPIPTMR